MRHNIYVVAAAAVGLLATACSGSPHSGTSTTTSGTPIKVLTTTVSQATTTTAAGPTRRRRHGPAVADTDTVEHQQDRRS